MGRALISERGNDKHAAVVEELPRQLERPVVDQVLQVGRGLVFSGELKID